MIKLDKKNCTILNLLQKDCRMSLTKISKEVGLSIDSTKKRIIKMIEGKIFYPKVQLRPRNFGFSEIIDVRIKLHNSNSKDIKEFIDYLVAHDNITEVFTLSGQWDFSIVIMAKNAYELGLITQQIRNKFNKIIDNWSESLTTCAYKFEKYDMLKIMGHKE